MKLILAAASLLVTGCLATALCAKASAPAAILFPGPSGHVIDLEWASVPDDAEFQRALPATATTTGSVAWTCDVRRDGHLIHCTVYVEWPEGGGFARATRPLLKQYVLGSRSVEAALNSHSQLILSTALWRPGLPHAAGCPAPFCTSTPPPPPFPPKGPRVGGGS